MDGSITVHVVEPGSNSTVPNTGLFLGGSGGTLLLSAILVLVILIQAPVFIYAKKRGKSIRFSRFFATKASVVPVLISLFALTALVVTNINAADSNENDSLITVENADLTIELGNEPVFAYVPVSIKFKEATSAGYSISSYAKTAKLTREGSDEAISLISATDEPSSLADNTWGFALEEPNSEKDKAFITLPKTEEDALVIKSTGYEETPAEDEIIVYYGLYVTPDLPYGTYSGLVISYEAEENTIATVTFDSNGLYFDDNEEQTTNTVNYIPGSQSDSIYSHTPNLNDEGIQDGVYDTNLNETFVYSFPNQQRIYFEIIKGYYDAPWTSSDYFSIWSGSHPDYTALDNWNSEDSIKELGSNGKYNFDRRYNNRAIYIPSNTLTLAYTTDGTGRGADGNGYGYYARITAYTPNTEIQGSYETPLFASDSYNFIGWSEDKDATTATYANQEEIARKLNLNNRDITLYAIYQRANTIIFDGNDSDDGEMQNQVIWSNTTASLNQNTYSKSGFGFVEWNTERDGSGISYTDGQDYIPSNEITTVTLYAQWRYDTYHIGYNGNGDDGTLNMNNVDAYTTTLDGTARMSLMAPNFKKSGYGFVGWSEDKDAWQKLTDNNAANDSVIYGPNETFTLTETMISHADGNTIPFYAIWAPVEKDTSGNPVYLQNWAGCSTLTPTTYNSETNSFTVGKNTITVLTDIRDNNTYTIARLSDGNCWMTENFRMGFDQATTLTTETTQSAGTIPAASSNWSSGIAQQTNLDNVINTTVSPVYNFDLETYYYPLLDDKVYSYGGYYTWSTGINNTFSYDAEVNAPGSICPSGWQLPKGNRVNGSFLDLGDSMGGGMAEYNSLEASNRWRSFPNNFIISGIKGRGTEFYERGYRGHYLSSTAWYRSLNYHYGLEIKWGDVFNRSTLQRYNGYSLRCLTIAE